MNEPTHQHPGAIKLADAAAGLATDPVVGEHLARCVVCRVRVSRLRHAGPAEPGPDTGTVARVLESSVPPPGPARTFAATSRGGVPQPGELWRAGTEEALLVWVRRVEDGVADVLPVVLDTDLADETTLIVPASATQLGTELAIFVSVRATVDIRSFLDRVADLRGVAKGVTEVMAASRAGREPLEVLVGPPVLTADDQRIDYRQYLADVLADLSPTTWGARDAGAGGPGERVLDLLARELPERHAGTRVVPSTLGAHRVDDAHSLAACARVSFLDSFLVVATLSGPGAVDSLRGLVFLDPCSELSAAEPAAEAVAVVADDPSFTCLVIPTRQLRRAFEPPGGGLHGPWTDVAAEPLGAVDAIAKYLDRQASVWEVTETAALDPTALDLRALAASKAALAVDEITRQGRSALTPAKRATWSAPPADLPERIAALIGSLFAGSEPSETIEALLRDGSS